MDDSSQPQAIDVRKDEGVTVTFVDGHVTDLDLMTLRLSCPCATCRSLRDQGEESWPRPGSPRPLRITDAAMHGAWGLNLTWNDGHATGIYPFESLRRWDDVGGPFRPDSGLGGPHPTPSDPDNGPAPARRPSGSTPEQA